jgi:putrescine importer
MRGDMTQQPYQETEVRLRRVLTLWDLVIYGIVLIQPVAALPLFGHATRLSQGHAVSTIMLAMGAMICTAISYGRMANRYPMAGSAYTYVGRGLHPYLGFLTGWTMFMDYVFIPILCVIYTSVAAIHWFPEVPYSLFIFLFAAGFTFLNLRGIKVSARANWLLMVIMSAVVFYFMAAAAQYVFRKYGMSGLLTYQPFYHRESFSFDALWSGTALAALTYVGFDGLTTLSEEVENPRRNVLVATVLTCLITGIWSGSQVYLAQVAWPDWNTFTAGLVDEGARNQALDTAILSVANRVGGAGLDAALSFILIVGSIGSGVTGQVGAARLLYGMGRDKVLPKKIFGHLDRKHAVPTYNILLIGLLSLAGAAWLNYEETARLINFGAFLAFMGVNLATIREYYWTPEARASRNFYRDLLLPGVGFLTCLSIWTALPQKTFIIGGSWLLAGIVYLAFRTRGFQERSDVVEFLQNVE